MIHVRQIRASGWFYFYLLYAFEYLRNRFTMKHYEAYRNISFEIEAFDMQYGTLTDDEMGEVKR
jgi:hypothetical protein